MLVLKEFHQFCEAGEKCVDCAVSYLKSANWTKVKDDEKVWFAPTYLYPYVFYEAYEKEFGGKQDDLITYYASVSTGMSGDNEFSMFSFWLQGVGAEKIISNFKKYVPFKRGSWMEWEDKAEYFYGKEDDEQFYRLSEITDKKLRYEAIVSKLFSTNIVAN